MTIRWLTVVALLASAACSSDPACPVVATPPRPATFVVTVQDAATQKPLTTGISVVTDGGTISSCSNASPPLEADGGAASCTGGWEVAFYEGGSNQSGPASVAHTITVGAPGHRTVSLQVTAAFDPCGQGSATATNVVASLEPQ